MSERFEIETVYRVYDRSEGGCLEIRPHPEGRVVQVYIPDEISKKWYGDIDIALTLQQAVKLGEALIKAGS